MEFPRPISYFQIYVYSSTEDSSQLEKAQILRDTMIRQYPDIIAYQIEEEPEGTPHPAKYFKVHVFTPKQFSQVIPWLTVNRNGLSCLINPVTVNKLKDNLDNVMWLGKKLEMRV
ncbi:hypothetical protein K502DRAFT_304808 [Neoconidiobolus thromboides FSU 785]|nr:hypothetical protein K502DRAFT_304808 [Neoconidiobolus thromboides FSU 785]